MSAIAIPTTAQTIESAVLSLADLAVYIKRSLPSLTRDNAAGRLPRPIRISKSLRFLKADIDLWLEMGCPSREEFEQRRTAAR